MAMVGVDCGGLRQFAWFEGRWQLALSLHFSSTPAELSHWLCHWLCHDDDIINIGFTY